MIYTSRNSFRLLNVTAVFDMDGSTQVEILLGYLTSFSPLRPYLSTQVEILLGYLT